MGANEWVILTEQGDVYNEGVADWSGAMITTGLKAYSDEMPPHLMQFGLPLEQTEVLAQIKVGRAEAQRLRANNPARLPAVVPTKGYDW